MIRLVYLIVSQLVKSPGPHEQNELGCSLFLHVVFAMQTTF